MRNLGCKDITALTDTHGKVKTRVQVASNVKKTLFSVSKLVEAGNRVVFHERGSYIHNKASEQTVPIYRANGVYKMNLWMPKDTRDPKSVTTGRICTAASEWLDKDKPTTALHEVTDHEDDSASGFMRLLSQA